MVDIFTVVKYKLPVGCPYEYLPVFLPACLLICSWLNRRLNKPEWDDGLVGHTTSDSVGRES